MIEDQLKMPNSHTSDERTPDSCGPLADLASLTPEDFLSHIGERFRVTNQLIETTQTHVNPIVHPSMSLTESNEVVGLTLVEVTRYESLREREGGFRHRPREPFGLLFEGPAEPELMNATLRVEHEQLGVGYLFIGKVIVGVQHTGGLPLPAVFYEVLFG